MKQHEFDRQVFGDTAPSTEIDYDFYRRRAVVERHAAIAAFPGRVRAAVHGALVGFVSTPPEIHANARQCRSTSKSVA
jgi:hypothetical protein